MFDIGRSQVQNLEMSQIQNTVESQIQDMTQLLLLGKFEYTGGPIFKVVLEC